MCEQDSPSDIAEHIVCNMRTESFDLGRTLFELTDCVVKEPLYARALFFDADLEGSPGRARDATLKRLGDELDAALRDEARRAPPPITGEFMVSAIGHLLEQSLLVGHPEDFRRQIPGLVALVYSAYGFSEEGI